MKDNIKSLSSSMNVQAPAVLVTGASRTESMVTVQQTQDTDPVRKQQTQKAAHLDLLIEQGCTDIYVKLVEESSFKVRSEKAVKNYRDEL